MKQARASKNDLELLCNDSHVKFNWLYSRTSLLRTPGDFADLYVVSIGRCNHGPLNQIRYTKLPRQTL